MKFAPGLNVVRCTEDTKRNASRLGNAGITFMHMKFVSEYGCPFLSSLSPGPPRRKNPLWCDLSGRLGCWKKTSD